MLSLTTEEEDREKAEAGEEGGECVSFESWQTVDMLLCYCVLVGKVLFLLVVDSRRTEGQMPYLATVEVD